MAGGLCCLVVVFEIIEEIGVILPITAFEPEN